jgi:hypothetical protein
MLEHLKNNLGIFISVYDLGKIAGIIDFTRGLRALRQQGWDLEWKWANGTTCYRLNSLTKLPDGLIRKQIDTKTW